MRYGGKCFLAPGDTLKSKDEDMHFHRDMTYRISKVFNSASGMKVFVEDKHGFDIALNMNRFEYTGKTMTAIEKRVKKARIEVFIMNKDTEFSYSEGWDRSRGEDDVRKKATFYTLDVAHFSSNSEAKARVNVYTKGDIPRSDKAGTYIGKIGIEQKWIYNDEDIFNFLEDSVPKDKWDYGFCIEGVSYQIQDQLDHAVYTRRMEFPIFSEKALNRPEITYPTYRWNNWHEEDSFDVFLSMMAKLIFDKPELETETEKGMIRDIIIAYRDLPSSHSATSVSKLLLGKAKKKNQKVASLDGKYIGVLKQPQIYELASHIEKFLQYRNVFTTKESYSSGEDDEWRGNFEFIGSKYINSEKLDLYLSKI